MTDRGAGAPTGASLASIARHYDVSDDFFRLWLGPDLVYSCGWWDDRSDDDLAAAQRRKLDFYARELAVRGGRVLDVGCGWGAFVHRAVETHGATHGVGLTLSGAQAARARAVGVPGTEFRLESWVDHEPDGPYDAVVCIEAAEHFAGADLAPEAKVEVYQSFFARLASWLVGGGRVGLALICLDNATRAGTGAGAGPVTDLIRDEIFPESMSPTLSEMVLGWETHFGLETFVVQPDHYARTVRAWTLALRAHRAEAEALVGPETSRLFARYLAAAEAMFRLREQSLYRVILTKRDEPKRWAAPLRPEPPAPEGDSPEVASGAAIRHHYDVPAAFYRQWLGPTMCYSSGLGLDEGGEPLEQGHRAKVDWFATRVLAGLDQPARVLDVGCGWGGPLRLLMGGHAVDRAVGLTLSPAQAGWIAGHPIAGAEIRVESWVDHRPERPYDAIFSYGAFEHFARDSAGRAERVASYRAFFARCWAWLVDGGRVGLETIAHDQAPELPPGEGRGPMADYVLDLYPESIAPHLFELVLGFEPWFEVEALRADPVDFARTFRAWSVRLKAVEAEATGLVGADVVRRYRRYLAATEMQFRLGEITNHRVVLHRRPTPLLPPR